MQRLRWIGLVALAVAIAAPSHAQKVTEGFVKAGDGVELYYVKAGSGAQTVILPARLFTFEDFRWLAQRYTLISYDMRNRGRSARVEDLDKISLEADVADLEAIRRHFGVEKFHTIGYSYLGLMVDAVHARASRARRACGAARPGAAEVRHASIGPSTWPAIGSK